MYQTVNNAVLVPYLADEKLFLVQDRRGHKPPPWGFFGGAIETGGTPLQAVVREAHEELGVSLLRDELSFDGVVRGEYKDLSFTLHVFLW